MSTNGERLGSGARQAPPPASSAGSATRRMPLYSHTERDDLDEDEEEEEGKLYESSSADLCVLIHSFLPG
jgi:hypothetical protein